MKSCNRHNICRNLVFAFVIYLSTSYYILLRYCENSNDAIKSFNGTTLLVMAHPDDETMFFGPSILNLIKHNKSLHIICLSDGNADALGERRTSEMKQVVHNMGSNVQLFISHGEPFIDSLDRIWNKEQIDSYIGKHLARHDSIKQLVTFDTFGVSGHPNHISISKALIDNRKKYSNRGVKVLTLATVSILRKYLSFLDVISTFIFHEDFLGSVIPREKSHHSNSVILALDVFQYCQLTKILRLHESQMVWFRYLYMTFSRYMFINELDILET